MNQYPSDKLEKMFLNSLKSSDAEAIKRVINIKKIKEDCDRQLQEARDGAVNRIAAAKQAIAERRRKREQQQKAPGTPRG